MWAIWSDLILTYALVYIRLIYQGYWYIPLNLLFCESAGIPRVEVPKNVKWNMKKYDALHFYIDNIYTITKNQQ